MINREDVRQGNWVLFKGVPTQVAVFKDCGPDEECFQLYRPIRLRPEILEKCGFCVEDNRATLPLNKELSLELFADGTAVLSYASGGDKAAIRLPNNIIFLHTLQNVYYGLTGKELEPCMEDKFIR